MAALTEHVALWPLVALTDRLHPARGELPKLQGNRVAFLQGAWRHLLFGFVLGELERRINAEPEAEPPERRESLLLKRTWLARARRVRARLALTRAGKGGRCGS